MTITKSGELASFYTVNKAPIKHLRVYFSPKQAGEGDPSPENVREISGTSNIACYHGKETLVVGKFNSIQQLQYLGDNTFQINGTIENGLTIKNIPLEKFIIKPNQKYTVICERISGQFGNIFAFMFHDINDFKMYKTFRDLDPDTKLCKTSINPLEEQYNFINMTLSFGPGTSNLVFKMHLIEEPQDLLSDWSSSIGPLYGGYVDLVTGELVQNWYYLSYKYKEIADLAQTMTNCVRRRIAISDKLAITGINNSICNCLSYLDDDSDTPRYYIRAAGLPTVIHFVVPKNFDQEQDLQFAFKLATPITHQLTSTQLSTLIGQNNIWSNADRVEIEYDLAESNDELYRRRNIILGGYPHLETASGNITSFNTDITAQLKEAKIYFEPVQEGEGDPSPENIRPISGWTGLTTYYSGENLYIPNANNKGYISVNGVINVDTTSTYTDLIPVTAGETYSFKCTTACINEGTTNRRLHGYDSDGNWVKQITNRTTAAATVEDVSIIVTISSDVSYIRASFRNQDTNVRVAKENVVSVNWSTEAGTIYGGYLDLVKGEIVEEWHKIVADGVNVKANRGSYKSDVLQSYGGAIVYLNPIGEGNDSNAFCDNLLLNSMTTIPTIHTYARGQMYAIFYLFPYSNYEEEPTATDIMNATNEWLQEHPTTIIYKLRSPIHHPLTPQTLKTLRNTNNIWSNSNGNIEVKYWTH